MKLQTRDFCLFLICSSKKGSLYENIQYFQFAHIVIIKLNKIVITKWKV